jgi:hypothetical protein
MSDK